MTRYFLGIDVGGSKTHALIADEQGRACGFGKAGPGNQRLNGSSLYTGVTTVSGGTLLVNGTHTLAMWIITVIGPLGNEPRDWFRP